MRSVHAKDVIEVARNMCEKTGSRLTETRQHMLEVLLTIDTPKSAYELTEHYNRQIQSPIMTMSVYRILDFLESIQLVHRLHSINKYIICKHPMETCKHQISLFLICKTCQQIEEIEIAADLVKALSQHAENTGFVTTGSQIELNSLCKKCTSNIHQPLLGDFNGQDPTNK
jgi:Fur family zinc uptake transcriptional regulator